ncbi:hypothetical protein LVJ94_49255 [Pendulispora rubella]|uniref:Terminase large subunit gp17-like C-terminal domain-containing protein n=1 Tax=Pendulispora rubella TaxID=2741070 RepID=A0ABZ2L1P9_9BACT
MSKKSEEDLAAWLGTETGFISGICSYDGEPIRLEAYQTAFLNNRSRYRWITKARQIGFSFVMALESLARCHLRDGYSSVFVSYALSDATEKVLVARQVYEELPLAYQKKLITDSKTELAFESNRAHGRVSRIISVPSKAPRGKQGCVYLDELAHYQNDREVYRGSTALILRSNGQLTGCSTPLGRRGIFWEIAQQELRGYPHHVRQLVPWWLCTSFCVDVRTAAREAPHMPTAERVERFGRPSIIEQFESLPLEDFQQEFEALFIDETYSYYPYELILPCMSDDIVVYEDPTDVPAPVGRLVAGFDVGRRHDRSELAVFEEVEGRYTARMMRTFANVPFKEQEAEMRRVLKVLPIARMSIDRNGIGMHLAENLEREFPQVVPENSTNENKERWAIDLKILMQRRDVAMPRERVLIAQIHQIQKRILPSGKVSFDAERNANGHADKFWAVALACQKERTSTRSSGSTNVGVRIIG